MATVKASRFAEHTNLRLTPAENDDDRGALSISTLSKVGAIELAVVTELGTKCRCVGCPSSSAEGPAPNWLGRHSGSPAVSPESGAFGAADASSSENRSVFM